VIKKEVKGLRRPVNSVYKVFGITKNTTTQEATASEIQ
jgi:hypothetical protein